LKAEEKMKRVWLAFGILFITGILIAGHSAPAATKLDALLAADRAFDAATADKKLDGFSSFLADNVATLRADQPVLRGKVAMQQDWKPLLENKAISLRWQPVSAEISKSGDLGYTVGSYTITRTGEDGGAIAGTGKYLTIWRLQKDGSWKVEFDTGVPDTSPTPPKNIQVN
jgi:ketosteroid isomerase-like protein